MYVARRLFWIAIILTATPARAQTYDPHFPICLQTFGIAGNSIDCSYVSMDQCRLTAWGGAAQCITNPYFARSTRKQAGGMGYRW